MSKRFYIGLLSLAAAFILIRVLGPKILPRVMFSKSARTASIPFETYSEAALSRDGQYLARITAAGKELTVEKITPDGKLEKIHTAAIDFTTPSPGSEFANVNLSWSDEGSALVACSSNQLAVFDVESGYSAIIPFRTLFPSPKYGDKTGLRNAWVSAGARYLVAEQRESGLFDGLVFERNGTHWKEIRELQSSIGTLNTVRFSGDGKYMAVLSNELAIEETLSGKTLADRRAITEQITGSYDNGLFSGGKFIMHNSGSLSYYDTEARTSSTSDYLPNEVIALDKSGGRLFGVGAKGVMHSYAMQPGKTARDMRELTMDPAYRKTNFNIWTFYKAGEYPPGTTFLMSAAARQDGKLLLIYSDAGLLFQKTGTCSLDMLDIPMLMKLDYSKIKDISSSSAWIVIAIGLLYLTIAEFGPGLLSRFRSSKTPADGTVQPAAPVRSGGAKPAGPAEGQPRTGTTPGVVIFGLDNRIPSSADGMAAIMMFGMSSGNAHLMMGGIPKVCARLPSEPDNEAVVVAAYQSIARNSGWKVIVPECKAIRGGGGSKIIAYPRPEQL